MQKFSFEKLRVYSDLAHFTASSEEIASDLLLNIAEGNGRFAYHDHSRFLEIANRATTKLAARLEVGALRKTIEEGAADEIIGLLVSIDRMTAKLAQVWREKSSGKVS